MSETTIAVLVGAGVVAIAVLYVGDKIDKAYKQRGSFFVDFSEHLKHLDADQERILASVRDIVKILDR